jgi:hypothetical protein
MHDLRHDTVQVMLHQEEKIYLAQIQRLDEMHQLGMLMLKELVIKYDLNLEYDQLLSLLQEDEHDDMDMFDT